VQGSLVDLADVFGDLVSREHALALPLVAHADRHETERWARWLRLPRVYRDAAILLAERREHVVDTLRTVRGLSDSRLYRLFERFSPEVLVYLHAVVPQDSRELVERFLRDLVRIEPAVSGDDLVDMGLEPAHVFSAILDRARNDRLDGIAIGREAELDNLRRLAKEAGLSPRSSP
jgi:AraC-like DNA-binding protein